MVSTHSKILILDAMWNKTLAAVRSLGRRGFYLTVGEKTRFATALFSKYCSRRVIYPSPASKPDEFLDWLLKEVKANNYDMLLPTEFETLEIILKHKKEIEPYTRVPFADYNLISKVNDKAWLIRYAEKNGYLCPKTYKNSHPPLNPLPSREGKQIVPSPLAGEGQGEGGFSDEGMEYPLVIKPRESSGSRGLVYVNRPSEFLTAFQKVHSRYPFPLVQEYIPNGGAYGVGALFNLNSEPRAAFVYKRLREYPVSGGPSTLRESVKNDEIRDVAVSLLKSLNWVGVAMVEFRVDARDGKAKLMEINPRFWGSLQLAILSGMDFPYLLYKMAVDGDVEPAWDYETGIRCRWLIPGDILHFISNPERLRLNPSFFTRTQGDDIISAADPMPIVGRVSSVLPFFFNKEMRRLIFR
ncbi:MAG: ATP-grasp domain-containing protein [Deltaproteobacteria bacterium]|nr:ATP-grasp domain-containing protein [Deltaproteobacteria bacterium]